MSTIVLSFQLVADLSGKAHLGNCLSFHARVFPNRTPCPPMSTRAHRRPEELRPMTKITPQILDQAFLGIDTPMFSEIMKQIEDDERLSATRRRDFLVRPSQCGEGPQPAAGFRPCGRALAATAIGKDRTGRARRFPEDLVEHPEQCPRRDGPLRHSGAPKKDVPGPRSELAATLEDRACRRWPGRNSPPWAVSSIS